MALRIATSRLFLATRATERVPPTARLFSSSRALAAPWELFPATRQPLRAALPQTPLYLSDWRHNLEFALEKMRLSERPILSMQLLNRNARRPKKANHGKRPCSHHRRRLKRLGRRSSS